MRKVRCSGAISRSLVHCCRYKSSLKHFIFLVRRLSLRLAIRATQEEAGERVACKGISCSGIFLTRERCDSLVHTYLPTDDNALVYWPKEDCDSVVPLTSIISPLSPAICYICHVRTIDPYTAVNILTIDTLKYLYDFPHGHMCTTGHIPVHAQAYVQVRTG